MHHSSSIGGGSYCLLNVIKALDKQQFEPVVALKQEGSLTKELRRLGVEVVLFNKMADVPYNRTLWNLHSIKSYLSVFSSLNPFVQFLHKVKCDVLYLNNMMIYPYLRVARKFGMKTIIHVREHWPLDEHRVQLNWARKAVYSYADSLIAINNYSASIFPNKRATIVHDWIDMKSRNKPIPLSDVFHEDMTGKKVLLYLGGLSSIKGADYILDSFVHSVKSEDYRLLVIGVDSIPELSGLVHKVKLFLEKFGYYYYDKRVRELLAADHRIRCIPAIFEISDIIKQSHCFVSYFRIPHANLALAENIILGNPCIAADTEEAREYSGDGKYAKLVRPMNNQGVFSSMLIDFLKSIEQWKDAAREGIPELSEVFGPDRNISLLNLTLQKVLVNN